VALRLFLTPRAAREIRRAAHWWAANRPAAPGAIRTDLKATLDVLRDQPAAGMEVEMASAADVRRFYLDRIRYWVYYRERQGRLEVLSIWHASRGSGPLV
jgi:plasmid stabilization system protein ParE